MVEVPFLLDGVPAVFRRNSMTGRAELVVGDHRRTLQSPYNPATHFSIKTRTSWKVEVNGRTVEIVKERPLVMGGLRENTFTVVVDGVTVTQVAGT